MSKWLGNDTYNVHNGALDILIHLGDGELGERPQVLDRYTWADLKDNEINCD